MKNKLSILLATLFLSACEREEQTLRMISTTDITPGTTMIGGNTLNTAVIGDTLTISGTGFSSEAAENLVSVQNIPVRVLTASSTILRALVPVGVPFAYVDVVVARNGYQPAGRPISIRATPSPVITGIRPTQGRVGAVVTIYGKHLLETLEANQLTFTDANGQAATIHVRPINPVVATADSIRITVPAGAGTGKFTLYARLAQDAAASFGSLVTPVFTVTP